MILVDTVVDIDFFPFWWANFVGPKSLPKMNNSMMIVMKKKVPLGRCHRLIQRTSKRRRCIHEVEPNMEMINKAFKNSSNELD